MPPQTNEPDYSWFKREEYELQRHLEAADWASMLTIRSDFKKKYQSHLASILGEQKRKQFWDYYCKSVSLKEHLKNKKTGKISALPSREPPLVDVTYEMLSELSQEVITWRIAFPGSRVLLINPWA